MGEISKSPSEDMEIEKLERMANKIRKHIIKMTAAAGSGHPGGSLSATDIITALYFSLMKIRPDEPEWPDRDRFVLSKGHAAPALYAALAERGFFDTSHLTTLREIDSFLQGHPEIGIPGVDMSTGSLGQGLSIANGMALAARIDGSGYHVYALLGDGEIQEGQVWEAAMAAGHYRLANLTAILDYNRLQIDGFVDAVMNIEPVAAKWRSFGWKVEEIDDGHDIAKIIPTIEKARDDGRPTMIIARTLKGKGVSFMEDAAEWHGKAPDSEQAERALAELEEGK